MVQLRSTDTAIVHQQHLPKARTLRRHGGPETYGAGHSRGACWIFSHNTAKQGHEAKRDGRFHKAQGKGSGSIKELPRLVVPKDPGTAGKKLTCGRTHPRFGRDHCDGTATGAA